MAISYVNTTEVENISKDLISLANEFTSEINSLFNRFSEVPMITGEWVGNQSRFYFNRISSDKIQYIDFANKIREIGYKLNADMNEIEYCINRTNNNES